MSRRRTLIVVFGIIFVSAFLLVSFIQKKYVVPILMYHSVKPNSSVKDGLVISVNTFERQMRFLKKHHYNVVPLEAIAALIKARKKMPPKTVALTFDDGNKDNYTYVFHILKKYNLPATMFIIINEVARPRGDKLSWNEIKVMRDSGIIAFGSHTLGPEPLINIKSEEEIKRQISTRQIKLQPKYDSLGSFLLRSLFWTYAGVTAVAIYFDAKKSTTLSRRFLSTLTT